MFNSCIKVYHLFIGNTDICHVLLDKQVDIDPRENSGKTPLHFAAQQGHSDVCLALLVNGADKNPRHKSGRTPLHLAAYLGKDLSR